MPEKKKEKKKETLTTQDPRTESLGETLRHATAGHKYLITLRYHPEGNYYTREDTWTDLKRSTIARMGYDPGDKFHDDLRYLGVQTYVRMVGFNVAAAPNRETSSTMAGFYRSKALDNFEKGLTQIRFASMDKKTLIAMIPIMLGLVLGAYFLFMR